MLQKRCKVIPIFYNSKIFLHFFLLYSIKMKFHQMQKYIKPLILDELALLCRDAICHYNGF